MVSAAAGRLAQAAGPVWARAARPTVERPALEGAAQAVQARALRARQALLAGLCKAEGQ